MFRRYAPQRPHATWRIAEAETEPPVEVRDIGKADVRRDVGDPARTVARLGQQRERLLPSALRTPRDSHWHKVTGAVNYMIILVNSAMEVESNSFQG
jgi:hypothetical protein